MRIRGILAGSGPAGYSGGDLHAACVWSHWAHTHELLVYLPWGSSPDVKALFDQPETGDGDAAQQPQGAKANATRLSCWLGSGAPGSGVVLALLYALRTLTGCLDRRRYDVCVAATQFVYDVLPAALTRAKVRAVYVHHLVPMDDARRGWRRWLAHLDRSIGLRLIRSSGMLAFSGDPHTREALRAYGLPAERIRPTANAAAPWPASGQVTLARDIDVAYVGRLNELKGSHELPHIFGALVDPVNGNPIQKIVVCGTGPELDRLKEFASAHGGKIEVRGWVDEGEKWRVLARSRVVILPSYEEGWGISIQEALQAGAQVVAYDLPAVRRLHGNTIELVPRGDWQAMVERVRQLLTQAVSPGQQRHPPTEAASWKAIAEQELVDIEARLAAQQSRCRP